MAFHAVFVTGANGYLGRATIPKLIARGHQVRGLVRPGREGRLPPKTEAVIGDALVASSYQEAIPPADTLIHLVGTPRPNPRKALEFESTDLGSIEAAVVAAKAAGIQHLIYVSVAQPAPVMKAYVDVRRRGEERVRAAGFPSVTLLRPWYVLGPGHLWPYLLLPVYSFARFLPGSRDTARRLGPVSLKAMTSALVAAVEEPPVGVRVVEVPEIQRLGRTRPA
jgi:uncharacterized protein YbjT (DUF2867 family)